MAKNRGVELEEALQRSLPPEVYTRKLHTPAPPPNQVAAAMGAIERAAKAARMDLGIAMGLLNRSKFTPPSPYDFLLTVPATAVPGSPGLPQLKITIALELKSASGASLPWDALRDNQNTGLGNALAAGMAAGLLIGFPDKTLCLYYLSFEVWARLRSGSAAKSLPLKDAQALGFEIHPDPDRGRTLTYYDFRPWLLSLGAHLAPEQPKGKTRPRPTPSEPERGGQATLVY